MATAWIAYGDTYPVKDQLRGLGGKWNKERKYWGFDQEPTTQVAGVVFVPSPLPEGWKITSSINSDFEAGAVFVQPLSLADRKTGYYKRQDYGAVVAQWSDKKFSDHSERWETCLCTLYRPLTEEEWEQVLAGRVAKEEGRDSHRELRDLIYKHGSAPAKIEAIEAGEELIFAHRSQPHRAILSASKVYYLSWNGASGDDWSHNNYHDCIVHLADRTPEIEAAFERAKKSLKS